MSRNLGNFSHSFKSIFEDRLIPSSDLAKMQEEFYQNRMALLEMLVQLQNNKQIIKGIRKKNLDIDQITVKISKTYLTAEEEAALNKFYRQVKEYRDLEEEIIKLIEQGKAAAALELYSNQSLPVFGQLLATMRDLEYIQVVVGEELYHHAEHMVHIIQMMGYLSIAIALMITINMLKVLRFRVK